ncbi:MAG: nucleotidyl transferase AbiEii/AbiGii toxin family protein [Bacteroidales bacterium]|nr:nucleotidyl transferase AbiEii/AbiGii toxin family protein [Bacteroidales bacterium]
MLYKDTIENSTLELLKKLQADTELSAFKLAGGTSLALQIGHRKSIDLDLFSQNNFDSNYLLEYLEENYNFAVDYTSKNTLKGSIKNIKIDLISHKYNLVKPFVKTENIILYSVEDIAAMKLNAISGNGTRSKDFIDIYFILKRFSVAEILEFYKKKYKLRNSLHVIKSLNYFNDIDTQDWPEMLLEKQISIEQVKQNIEIHIKNFSENLI